MKSMKVLAASILASSPLSKMPKPQMPPHSFGSPAFGGGKGHGEDLVAAVGQAGVVVVGVQLLCNVPAEGHLQGAVAEQGDLLAAVDGSIEVDALCIVQSLNGLDIFRESRRCTWCVLHR